MLSNDKIIVAIGGGELREKTTLKIDEYIANLAKAHAGAARANALFIGTASHDSMPYFNTFRKTYTSVFGLKSDVALTVYGEMDMAKITDKFAAADMIYVGGGDTKYMLEQWKRFGLTELVLGAYERGVVISGLSAGAICWFDKAYSDYDIVRGQSGEYKVMNGLGIVRGLCCPHYNERREFDAIALSEGGGIAIENDCAVVIRGGEIVGSVSTGGRAFRLSGQSEQGAAERTEILPI